MKITAKAFGSELRSLREGKGLGLRELAKKARISPAFLSKVERGEVTPPAEKKLRSLARVLECEPDVLLAMAGRLPDDILKIIQQHPHEYMALLRDLRARSAEELNQARKIFSVSLPVTPELAHLFTKGEVNQVSGTGDKSDRLKTLLARYKDDNDAIRTLLAPTEEETNPLEPVLAPTEKGVGPLLEALEGLKQTEKK